MLDDLRYRLRAVFRRRAVERELDDELRFHIEQYAAIEERAGATREEALRRARLAFGAVEAIKEESRDGRGVGPIEIAWRDLRRLIAAGLILGTGLAVVATGAARGLLFGLEPRDPVTVAAAVAALGGLAVLASAIPARRAAGVDPIATLKDE